MFYIYPICLLTDGIFFGRIKKTKSFLGEMKMKIFRRIAAVLLILFAALVMFSCGDEADGREFFLFENEAAGEFFSGGSAEIVDSRGTKVMTRERVSVSKGRGDAFATRYTIFDIAGGEKRVIQIPEPGPELPVSFRVREIRSEAAYAMTPDGGVVVVYSVPKEYEKRNYTDERGGSREEYITVDAAARLLVVKYGADGKSVFRAELGEDGEELERIGMIVSDGGYVFLSSGKAGAERVIRVSADGAAVDVLTLPAAKSMRGYLMSTDGGKVCFTDISISSSGGGNSTAVYTIGEKGEKIGGAKEFSVSGAPNEVIFTDGKYDFCYRSSSGFYGVSKNGAVQLFDWFDFGLSDSDVEYFLSLGADSGFVVYSDPVSGERMCGDLKRCEFSEYLAYFAGKHGEEVAKEFESRKVLKIAVGENPVGVALESETTFMKYLNRFCRENMQYRVKLSRISGGYYSLASDLTRKMAAGDVPDLVVFSDWLPSGGFNQELLLDLNGFFDADTEFSREEIVPCALDSFENFAGELKYLTTAFNFTTMAGLSEVFDGVTWNLDGFTEFIENLPEDMVLADLHGGADDPRSAFLRNVMSVMASDFIDYEKKVCDFESGDFARLLTAIKNSRFGDGDGRDAYGYSTGGIALNISNISDISMYLMSVKGKFLGSGMKMLGYPSRADGAVTAIVPSLQLGIVKGASETSGAWEFIKEYVGYQYEDEESRLAEPEKYAGLTSGMRSFPCSKAAVEIIMSFAGQTHCEVEFVEYTDKSSGARKLSFSGTNKWNYRYDTDRQTGNEILVPIDFEDDSEFVAGFQEKLLKNYRNAEIVSSAAVRVRFGERDIDGLWSMFYSRSRVKAADSKTLDIIVEEAGEYFSGAKELEGVLRSIQDRVSTRISE